MDIPITTGDLACHVAPSLCQSQIVRHVQEWHPRVDGDIGQDAVGVDMLVHMFVPARRTRESIHDSFCCMCPSLELSGLCALLGSILCSFVGSLLGSFLAPPPPLGSTLGALLGALLGSPLGSPRGFLWFPSGFPSGFFSVFPFWCSYLTKSLEDRPSYPDRGAL